MYQPLISIVIPVRNEGDRITKTINFFAFHRSNLFQLEFIIVDDASTDGCCTLLENLLNWERDAAVVHVIKLNQWSGIPYSRNVGANYARAPILFITDANVEACHNWDIPLFRDLQPGKVLAAAVADSDRSCVGYGCVLRLPSMGVSWMISPFEFKGDIPVSACAGTIIHSELFRRSGGYDTSMPLYGAAEPEFSVRLWLYGTQIKICPDLVLSHRFRPAHERDTLISQIELLQIKNYLRFAWLYLNTSDLNATFHHYSMAAPALFNQAMQQLVTDETIAQRKAHLQKVLLRDFDWYKNKFGINT